MSRYFYLFGFITLAIILFTQNPLMAAPQAGTVSPDVNSDQQRNQQIPNTSQPSTTTNKSVDSQSRQSNPSVESAIGTGKNQDTAIDTSGSSSTTAGGQGKSDGTEGDRPDTAKHSHHSHRK